MDGHDQVERQLCAVLAADAVGYSTRMAQSDLRTVQTLEHSRSVFAKEIEICGGTVIDMAGDSVLAIFNSATQALRASLEVQAKLAPAEGSEAWLPFRIGVHLGDVIKKPDGSVYGDGINVAARLQATAEPHHVITSSTVRQAVGESFAGSFIDVGELHLKNIAFPVHAFKVTRQTGPNESASFAQTFAVTGPVKGFGGRPAIAVLPFENMSADPDQLFFADGIAEDILTRLAMWKWMPVIARSSSFAFRGQPIDLRQIGEVLGARYILQGSVRRAGDRVRVTGQLIDAETGHHVWAERYDRNVVDVFALQDEITDAVVTALEPTVGRAERVRASRKAATDNLDAWELYHRASGRYAELTKEGFSEALELSLQAASKDPEFASPLALAALTKLFGAMFGWFTPAQSADFPALAREALRRDGSDPMALATTGAACAALRAYDEGLKLARKSIEINPSYAVGHYCIGWLLMLNGEPAEAVREMELSVRLSPHDLFLPQVLASLSAAHVMEGSYGQARDVALLGLQVSPQYPMLHRSLTNAYGLLGEMRLGRESLSRFLALVPGYSSAMAERSAPFRRLEDQQRYLAGFEALGWSA